MINTSLPSYKTTGELPTEKSDWTYTLTTTFYRDQKITIEIEILKKCEGKNGFRIVPWDRTQQANVSRKVCESRDYWNKKNPNENLIVSFYNKCSNFDFIKDVVYLVKHDKKKVFVHSSSCPTIEENDKKDPKKGKGENDLKNRIGENDQNSSQTERNLLVISICNVG